MFHRTHGFYVHGILVEAAKLPDGWKTRVVSVSDPIGTHGKIGYCIEIHDLAASKLAAYREKDREFVRLLLIENLINPPTLMVRTEKLNIEDPLKKRLMLWIKRSVAELNGSA